MQTKTPRFVSYLRVSTARQGRSGLGLDAQRAAVQRLVTEHGGRIVAPEFIEVESGADDDRPQLEAAFKRCRQSGATLCIAKLDRLSRSAAFLMKLQEAGVKFLAADAPYADDTVVGVLAVMARKEREAISDRTKQALAAAKRRGVVLGGYRKNAPDISKYTKRATEARVSAAVEWAEEWREMFAPLVKAGLSCAAIAAHLNSEGCQTRAGAEWAPAQVHRTVKRLGL